jgi:predicted dehydrogenase
VAEPLRIGLIGAGANTRLRHIPGLQAIDGVEVVAVCNRSEESGRRVAEEFGIARVEREADAIFSAPDVDAVCIGTWPYMHREYTVRALDAGKHVLCEARMAMDAGEAREMLEAAQRHPELVAQLVPAPFDFRFWRTIRRLVGEGALGELREVHVTLLNGNSLNLDAPLHWRERVEYSGMNVMMFGILIEVVSRWLGPTRRVLADAAVFIDERRDEESGETRRIEVPDSLGVLAQLDNGARVTYRVSTALHAPRDANGISLYGSKGTLHWEMGDRMSFAPLGAEPAPLEPDPGTAEGWRVEQDFVDSIREGKPVTLTSFEDGLHYMRVTEAVHRSRTEGRAVSLDEV